MFGVQGLQYVLALTFIFDECVIENLNIFIFMETIVRKIIRNVFICYIMNVSEREIYTAKLENIDFVVLHSNFKVDFTIIAAYGLALQNRVRLNN